MAYIYKIINDINNKVYIGKTAFDIEKRFKEHCQDRTKRELENRPLYNAMNKYGIEHFKIELIEECSNIESSIKEIYWIGYYDSYQNGYNATLGGDGKFLFNHEEIKNRLKENPYPIKVAQEFNCSVDLVYEIVKEYNIIIKNLSNEELREKTKKSILQYDKNNNFIQSFDAVADAARWCHEQGLCATLNSGVRSHIAECANGKRKSAYQYIWKYKE